MQFLTVTGYTINTEDIRLVEWSSSNNGGCTIYLRQTNAVNREGPNQIELTSQEAKGLRNHFQQLATVGQAIDLTGEGGGQTGRPTQRATRAANA